jgi:hypothetical protein
MFFRSRGKRAGVVGFFFCVSQQKNPPHQGLPGEPGSPIPLRCKRYTPFRKISVTPETIG